MALSQIQQLEHGRKFSDFLTGLRSPITNGVMPNLAVAIAGYEQAASAFGPGGKFDTVTASDYQEINQRFAQQFGELSSVLATEYKPPSDAMSLVDIAIWLGEVVVQLDAMEPGLFGGMDARADRSALEP